MASTGSVGTVPAFRNSGDLCHIVYWCVVILYWCSCVRVLLKWYDYMRCFLCCCSLPLYYLALLQHSYAVQLQNCISTLLKCTLQLCTHYTAYNITLCTFDRSCSIMLLYNVPHNPPSFQPAYQLNSACDKTGIIKRDHRARAYYLTLTYTIQSSPDSG